MRRHMERIHERQSRAGRRFLWIVGLLLSLLLWDTRAYAAGGRLSIAVDTNVAVGSEVTVVLSAVSSGGERASANMEFTYNSSIFSFVSCNAENYSGGPGGSVSFYGSSVTVKLRAESAGSSSFRLTGSGGTVRETGEALDQMEAAGVTVEAAGEGGSTGSADNSLAALSLSQGELSPAFSSADTIYTASVPYETESLEVNASTSHPKAQITSIDGYSELKVGENTIHITVEAENGEEAVYTITVTRAEAPQNPPEEGNGQEPPEGGDSQDPTEGKAPEGEPKEPEDSEALEKVEEYEKQLGEMKDQYQQLLEKYRKEKSGHRKVMAVLIFLLVVMVIVCVNTVIFRRGRGDAEEEDPAADRLARARERKQAREEAKQEKLAAKAEKEAAKAEKEAAKAEKAEKIEKQAAKAEKEAAKEEKKEPQGIGKDEKEARRKVFRRKPKEEWLDEEDVDMESAIFSTTIIPAPRREDGATDETVDFIDLDKL